MLTGLQVMPCSAYYSPVQHVLHESVNSPVLIGVTHYFTQIYTYYSYYHKNKQNLKLEEFVIHFV